MSSITHRSGLTPDEPAFPYLGPSPYAGRNVKNYQRNKLLGFTTEELARLDCLPTRELRPGNLQNDILPLLRRDRWERQVHPDYYRADLYPIASAPDEFWEVGTTAFGMP